MVIDPEHWSAGRATSHPRSRIGVLRIGIRCASEAIFAPAPACVGKPATNRSPARVGAGSFGTNRRATSCQSCYGVRSDTYVGSMSRSQHQRQTTNTQRRSTSNT